MFPTWSWGAVETAVVRDRGKWVGGVGSRRRHARGSVHPYLLVEWLHVLIAEQVYHGEAVEKLKDLLDQFRADPAAAMGGQDLEQRDVGAQLAVAQRGHEAYNRVAFSVYSEKLGY